MFAEKGDDLLIESAIFAWYSVVMTAFVLVFFMWYLMLV